MIGLVVSRSVTTSVTFQSKGDWRVTTNLSNYPIIQLSNYKRLLRLTKIIKIIKDY